MKTIETTVYELDELSDKAKEKARDWFKESSIDDEWYDFIYSDAKEVGITIKSFDLYRCSIELDIDSTTETMEAIKKNHGEACDTYKAAKAFDAAIDAMPDSESPDYRLDDYDVAESDFITALERAYLKMLADEYKYHQSNEYIDEIIRINKYTFTESGKRFG